MVFCCDAYAVGAPSAFSSVTVTDPLVSLIAGTRQEVVGSFMM